MKNTTEPRKCIRNFVFRSHSGSDCAPVYGQWVKVPTGRIPGGLMASPISPRQRHDLPMAIRTCPESGESGGGQVHPRHCRGSQNPATCPFMPWPRPLVDERADGSHSGRGIPLQTACPEAFPRINAFAPTLEDDPKIGHRCNSSMNPTTRGARSSSMGASWERLFLRPLRLFHRQVGWRHPGRRHTRFQWKDMVGSDGQTHVRRAARH